MAPHQLMINNTDRSLVEFKMTEPKGALFQDKYHAFLVHSKVDAEFVESVMDTLEKRGVSCCYSKKDFRPGTTTVSCIEEALEKCTYVICFLSKDFLTSPWCKHERDMALHKAAETSEDIIVPILLDASFEDLPRNIRRLTHIRGDDTKFEKRLFFSLGVPEGNSRPTYSDLEARNAELKTKLDDAEEEIKIKDDALNQQQMHIEQCNAKINKYETDLARSERRCREVEQMLCGRVTEEPKTQMKEKWEMPTQYFGDMHKSVIKEFSHLLKLGKDYDNESRWQDVIKTLKNAERIVKKVTNNAIPERMIFEMLILLWRAYNYLGDFQASIAYGKEALSRQHKMFGPIFVNENEAQCYHSCALSYELWGGFDEAIELCSTSAMYYGIMRAKTNGDKDIGEKLSRSLQLLGRAYIKKRDMQVANSYLTYALDEEFKLHGQDKKHPHIKEIKSLLMKTDPVRIVHVCYINSPNA